MICRSTQLKAAKQCIAKSYYRYELGLRRRGNGKSVDLAFGSLVHNAVEKYLKEGYEKASEYLDREEFYGSGVKTKGTARILLNLFRMKFHDEFICSEQYFKIYLTEDFTLIGKFDFMARGSFGTYVGEIKTSQPYYLISKPDDQFISYYMAAREIWPQTQNVILYNLDPSQMELVLTPISFSADEVKEWQEETKAFLSYYKNCVESGNIVRSPGACLDYGYRCEYMDLCTTSKRIREVLVDNAFEVDEEQKNLAW